MSEFRTILFEREDELALVTLNRPERLNAYNMRMRDELFAALTTVRDDATIGTVILQGAGRTFCVGGDISEFGSAPSPVCAREVRWQRDVWGLLRSLPAITIAAIHGHAAGSGMELALLCDLRVAATDAVFSLPETAIGLIPGVVGTQTAPRIIGEGRALALMLAGDRIDARRALRIGLVGSVVPRSRLWSEARRIAYHLSGIDRDLRCKVKALVFHGMDLPLETALRNEAVVAEGARKILRRTRS